MSLVATRHVCEPRDVRSRLSELGLEFQKLLAVVKRARWAAADATAFHPMNAAGTFAYQEGTCALREEHVGPEWEVDRTDHVESIFNRAKGIKVVFANVDQTCDMDLLPRSRSTKGAGSERVCQGNLFESLPRYAPKSSDKVCTYYLMVDEVGSCELSAPVIKKGKFDAFIERIFLSQGSGESDLFVPRENEDGGGPVNFDPQVVRK